MKTFFLLRKQDLTGISGTGVVAEGVQFSDGSAALRWLVGDHQSTVVYASIEAVEYVHGHGGATQIIWRD